MSILYCHFSRVIRLISFFIAIGVFVLISSCGQLDEVNSSSDDLVYSEENWVKIIEENQNSGVINEKMFLGIESRITKNETIDFLSALVDSGEVMLSADTGYYTLLSFPNDYQCFAYLWLDWYKDSLCVFDVYLEPITHQDGSNSQTKSHLDFQLKEKYGEPDFKYVPDSDYPDIEELFWSRNNVAFGTRFDKGMVLLRYWDVEFWQKKMLENDQIEQEKLDETSRMF